MQSCLVVMGWDPACGAGDGEGGRIDPCTLTSITCTESSYNKNHTPGQLLLERPPSLHFLCLPPVASRQFDPKIDEKLKQEYMDELHVMRCVGVVAGVASCVVEAGNNVP